MKSKKEYLLPDSPGLLVYCPLCDSKYNPFHARVLETKEDNHLLHTQCQHCGVYIISLVTQTPFGLSSVGIISDLSASDVLKFKMQPKISYDDVIECHQVISESHRN